MTFSAATQKILLIECELLTRQSMRSMLSQSGYRVVEATDGYEGLEASRLESPALVLVDLQMPRMDGLDFLGRFREFDRSTPVVVIADDSALHRVGEAMQKGAWDYLERNASPDYLKLIVSRTLERARLKAASYNLPSSPSKSGTMGLTLLVVEDDITSRKMLKACLAKFFKQVLMAEDGEHGFQLYGQHNPDIVLTDQMMPGLSGLELMHKIRLTGAKTPVVLMTSSIDNQVLLEAINTGVERFIPKPLDFDLIVKTLNGIARELINERLLELHRLREIELLRYKDTYNSMQQESSRRKERHVVRHDLRNQMLEGAGTVRWGINVAYSPHDIMCGDGYSVRNLFDGRQLVLMVDAMGSGLSASLTAMLTTSFFNYQVENLHLWEVFTLPVFLKRFQEYLSSMLLEEEVLSCGFFLVDLVKEEIEIANFALPPLLLRSADGSVRRVRGENPPLGIYPSEVRIGNLSLAGVTDLLLMTDGVTDAQVGSDSSYREEIEDDFRASPTLAALFRRFRAKTGQESLDDLTLMHLRRLDLDCPWTWNGEVDLTLAGLGRTIVDFLNDLALEIDLDDSERDELELILTEALTNAFEHGCLGIDAAEKTRLQLEETYGEVLETRSVLPGAGIALRANLWCGAEKPLLLMEVSDNGKGVPADAISTDVDANAINGRGLRMISRYCDSLFVGKPGGCLLILKTLEGVASGP